MLLLVLILDFVPVLVLVLVIILMLVLVLLLASHMRQNNNHKVQEFGPQSDNMSPVYNKRCPNALSFIGENPHGMWQLKIIDNPINEIGERLLNGFGTLHLDTSKQDTDVEDLEEQVIDDQTKQQLSRVQQLKQQVMGCLGYVLTSFPKN